MACDRRSTSAVACGARASKWPAHGEHRIAAVCDVAQPFLNIPKSLDEAVRASYHVEADARLVPIPTPWLFIPYLWFLQTPRNTSLYP